MYLKFKIFIISLVTMMFVSPVFAAQMDPTGMWEADDGESRYEVSLCGDGTQLCAKLVWIQPDKIKKANKVYIDTYVVNKAKKYTNREWRGTISIYGQSVYGNVQAYSKDRLMVKGCALIVICIKKGLTRMQVVDKVVLD